MQWTKESCILEIASYWALDPTVEDLLRLLTPMEWHSAPWFGFWGNHLLESSGTLLWMWPLTLLFQPKKMSSWVYQRMNFPYGCLWPLHFLQHLQSPGFEQWVWNQSDCLGWSEVTLHLPVQWNWWELERWQK